MPSHAQPVLKSLIQEEFSNMTAFARRAGVDQSLVWRDCHGRRMSDERFLAYLGAFSPEGKERLLRARLRDILPEDVQKWITIASPSGRAETSKFANIELLAPKARSALDQLAGEMTRDTELREWMLRFIEKVC